MNKEQQASQLYLIGFLRGETRFRKKKILSPSWPNATSKGLRKKNSSHNARDIIFTQIIIAYYKVYGLRSKSLIFVRLFGIKKRSFCGENAHMWCQNVLLKKGYVSIQYLLWGMIWCSCQRRRYCDLTDLQNCISSYQVWSPFFLFLPCRYDCG